MKSVLADIVHNKSPKPDASAEGCGEAHPRANTNASIFQVLSLQQVHEQSVDLLEDYIKGRLPEETTGIDQPAHYDYESVETIEIDQHIATEIQDDVQKLHGSALGIKGKTQPLPEIVLQSKNKTHDYLSFCHQRLNFTTNASMERLKGAAEYRKREVTRGRYLMEQKEQIKCWDEGSETH